MDVRKPSDLAVDLYTRSQDQPPKGFHRSNKAGGGDGDGGLIVEGSQGARLKVCCWSCLDPSYTGLTPIHIEMCLLCLGQDVARFQVHRSQTFVVPWV
jgi:hypothetical protein